MKRDCIGLRLTLPAALPTLPAESPRAVAKRVPWLRDEENDWVGESGDSILETRGLSREFKGFVAVADISMRVRKGTIHALIGPNGAGKTTLFNLVTRFLSLSSGRIVFKGVDITGEKHAALRAGGWYARSRSPRRSRT